MPNNDIEVFEHLLSDDQTPVEIDYLTYAVFAYRKQQWIDLFRSQNNGAMPSQGAIDAWIQQITPYEFRQMRGEAADFFHTSAEEHLKEYIEDQKRDAVENSILSQVKSFTSPWRHLGIALLMALVAPIVLGGIVFFASIFDSQFPVQVTLRHASPPPTVPTR